MHNKSHTDTLHLIDYLFDSFKNHIPSTDMKFKSHIETEKNSKSLKCSNAFGYDEIPTKI